jgi:hypothetical protein
MAVPTPPTAGEPVAEAWGDVVHDAVVAMDIQVGSLNITHSAQPSVSVAVTFPRPFASAPIVVASLDNAVSASMVPKVLTPTATGFTAISQDTGSTARTGTTRYSWIAYGARA